MFEVEIRNERAFTLIELIVVIAIIGILILLAAPKFLGYTKEAKIAQIKHDVKVMETEVETVLIKNNNDFTKWSDNDKNLQALIAQKNLFEYKGLAKKLEKANITNDNQQTLKIGAGGPLLINEENVDSQGYKIIPEKHKTKIKTKLKGTFYSNSSGKVYYEPDKPIAVSENISPACEAPEPLDYEFEHESGTIVKYLGSKQFLTIPHSFKVDGKCWPVRIIGEGAFANGYPPIREIVIPPTVENIEDGAFENNEIENVVIPPGVGNIGDNAFGDNPIKDVIVQRPESDIIIGDDAFGDYDNPKFETPSDEDLNINVEVENGKGTITGGSDMSGPGGASSGSSGGTIVIPPIIIVDDEEVEITEVEEGAFQGEGLIYVELPFTLERIEEYAFAGNQLIGISIPEGVNHIGNYAFGYNELSNGRDYKWSMGYIDFKGEELISKVNRKNGNIEDKGSKIELLKGTNMLDHIWIHTNSDFESSGHPDKENGGDNNEGGNSNESESEDEDIEIDPDIGKYIATDEDFVLRNGSWIYTGNREIVEIPHKINGEQVTSYNGMFSEGRNAKVSNVKKVISTNKNITDMSSMFSKSESLRTLDLSSLDTSNVTNMRSMFFESKKLNTLDLSGFDTSAVTDMRSMFEETGLRALDLSNFDTSNVTNMMSMFGESRSLTNLNLSSFDTSNVTSMRYMFEWTMSLRSLDLSHFDTSNVTNMAHMFYHSKNLEFLDLSGFNTGNVTTMNSMFYNAESLSELDLSSFDTSKVKNVRSMFYETKVLRVGWARTDKDAEKFNSSDTRIKRNTTFKTKDQ